MEREEDGVVAEGPTEIDEIQGGGDEGNGSLAPEKQGGGGGFGEGEQDGGGGESGGATPHTAVPLYETVYTNAKAGMDGVDTEKVKRVVYEMSKDSAYFQNDARKNAATEEKIKDMKKKMHDPANAQRIQQAVVETERLCADMEARRDLTKVWIHVDMDAFFASVEELLDPSLKGKPFAVGGMSMISTASYEARKYGVRSAMPGFIGRELCPSLVFVKPKFDRYREYSMKTRDVLLRFDPHLEAASLDEAYLDVTEYCRRREVAAGEEVAWRIREAVKKETGGLTCSCGVAPNKMLAKICSDLKKPDGQYVLKPLREDIVTFMSNLSVRKVPGIGRVTEKMLAGLEINTCGDIIKKKGIVSFLFSKISSEFFIRCAMGLGGTTHSVEEDGMHGRKGISCERTFSATGDEVKLAQRLDDICHHLSAQMNDLRLKGRTVTLKMKLSSFEVKTRTASLGKYVHEAKDLWTHAMKLLKQEFPCKVRLLGVRVSGFPEDGQLESGQMMLDEALKRKFSNHHQPGKSTQADGMPSRVWTCQACTFQNVGISKWCAVCETSQSGYRVPEPPLEKKKKKKSIRDFYNV